MASLRNAAKTQKVHKERHQPLTRSHLGPLEKKKDYTKRARDHSDKRKTLKRLHKLALERNPDEFHFHMINSEVKDGVHYEKVEDQDIVISDVAQDLSYIKHRRSIEKKKIDKLKAQLHLLQANNSDSSSKAPQNKHIIFVDKEEDANKSDAASLLDTHPDLLHRSFNRLRTSQLNESAFLQDPNIDFESLSKGKKKAYKELAQRIERENKLRILQEKLEVRKRLTVRKKNGEEMPTLVKEGTKDSAPIYKWPQERKR